MGVIIFIGLASMILTVWSVSVFISHVGNRQAWVYKTSLILAAVFSFYIVTKHDESYETKPISVSSDQCISYCVGKKIKEYREKIDPTILELEEVGGYCTQHLKSKTCCKYLKGDARSKTWMYFTGNCEGFRHHRYYIK